MALVVLRLVYLSGGIFISMYRMNGTMLFIGKVAIVRNIK